MFMMTGDSTDADEIIPQLWVSGIRAARDMHVLNALQITHVVSLGVQLQPAYPGLFKYHSIDIEDNSDANILQHFDAAYEFIDAAISESGNVLVHCTAGVSRSVTIAACYIMRKTGITPEQAVEQVQAARKIACPNLGFRNQLALYHSMHCTIDPQKPEYRHWLLTAMAREREATGAIAHMSLGADPMKTVKPPPTAGTVVEGEKKLVRQLKCKKCRRTLATEHNIVPHTPGAGQSAFSYHKRASPFSSESSSSPCTSYYLEAMEWIKGLEGGEMEGKINCPKCDAKLGSYSWAGTQCSCGTWVTPAFAVQRGRVDEGSVLQ
ncbi:dual specificity phosphatase 12 [Rhizophlyctis rosea]|nr:dual specificity phosphatase 12 [Rhizophlyctis rosea]